MANRFVLPVAIFVAGLLIGGVSVHYEQVRSFDHSKEAFARKARCKLLADRYVKAHDTDAISNTLEETGYSGSENTCMAAITVWTNINGPGGSAIMRVWDLVDLTSGKVSNVGLCDELKNCGNGAYIKYGQELDADFKASTK